MKSKSTNASATFKPVAFDPAAYVKKRSKSDAAFGEAYLALNDEFATLDALLQARKASGLTQVEIAARMGIKPSSLARIESSITSQKHSPSLATLRKYAQACGKRLSIALS